MIAAVLGFLAIVGGIGSFVCWIIVLIKIFQDKQIAMGVVSIFCGIVAFALGWMNADKFGVKTIMVVWTICLLAAVVGQVGIAAVAQPMVQRQL